jgi:pimeloyl-ACP methyl ester carboxylesterase
MAISTPTPNNRKLRAPGVALLALELRAPLEFGALVPAWIALQRAPHGDGHTVLVFPGLSASDASTYPLRGYLNSLGYDTQGWSQGFNFGPRAGVFESARRGLTRACDASGRKVSLIGWSLGGVYARELAKEMPDLVRCVITLGAPFAAPPKATNAWRIYQLTSGIEIERDQGHRDLPTAPPQPTTSIYSRSDGIVPWRGSVQDPHHAHTENVEVVASHIGLGLNASTWWAVADRLSQPEGRWRPFQRAGLFGLKSFIYPDPNRD